MIYRLSIIILIVSVLIACDFNSNKNQKYSKILTRKRVHTSPRTFENLSMEDCDDFAVLMSANRLGKKLKKSKDWIRENYQIPLYADTIAQTSRIIGHALPGSQCFVAKQAGHWFYIQNPVNNELGWLHQDFVVGFVKKNRETLLPCPG